MEPDKATIKYGKTTIKDGKTTHYDLVRGGAPLKDGDTTDVTLVVRDGFWSIPGGPLLFHAGLEGSGDGVAASFRRNVQVFREKPKEIQFETGDVLVITVDNRFGDHRTVVRGTDEFHDGNISWTDREIRGFFNAGKARMIARQGGPVVAPITRENVHLLDETLIPF